VRGMCVPISLQGIHIPNKTKLGENPDTRKHLNSLYLNAINRDYFLRFSPQPNRIIFLK
jgi:hypothetical protein